MHSMVLHQDYEDTARPKLGWKKKTLQSLSQNYLIHGQANTFHGGLREIQLLHFLLSLYLL